MPGSRQSPPGSLGGLPSLPLPQAPMGVGLHLPGAYQIAPAMAPMGHYATPHFDMSHHLRPPGPGTLAPVATNTIHVPAPTPAPHVIGAPTTVPVPVTLHAAAALPAPAPQQMQPAPRGVRNLSDLDNRYEHARRNNQEIRRMVEKGIWKLADGTLGFLDIDKIPEAGIKFLVSNYMDVKCVANESEALINIRLLLDIAGVEINESAQTWKCDKLNLSGNAYELTDGPSDAALSLLLRDHINGYASFAPHAKRSRVDDGTGLDLR